MSTAEAEVTRLRRFLKAILDHGQTLWPDTTCGRGGGVGGQAMTTTAHGEVVDHLAHSALRGDTITEAADQWEAYVPGSRRLDSPPAAPRRAGPDGRPA